ncbi:hypothetical protein [Caudoviricetes sp.]|nr:hypothetical protein [Caudoviricetes sp.]
MTICRGLTGPEPRRAMPAIHRPPARMKVNQYQKS